jgi:intein-encoded DNA endonuclease-like protein
MKSLADYTKVCELFEKGFNKSEIARELQLDRSTVIKWLKDKPTHLFIPSLYERIVTAPKTYSYILGLYLGDGYINKTDRSYRLRIALDKKYSELNQYASDKLKELFITNAVSIVDNDTWIDLSVYNKDLPIIFPQLGDGKKHNRCVALLDWQIGLIDWIELMKGLFHSDGSYYLSNDRDYYQFKNLSSDILDLFKVCCDKNNIKYTFGADVVRIYQRPAVNKMRSLIGIKSSMA